MRPGGFTLAGDSSGAGEHYRLSLPQKPCLWSPQIQRKMIQIYVSTGSPGAKDRLSLAVRRRHSVTMRTTSAGEPALPGKAFVGDRGLQEDLRPKASAAGSLEHAALVYSWTRRQV